MLYSDIESRGVAKNIYVSPPKLAVPNFSAKSAFGDPNMV
jgi:hypothetical protein